MSIVHTHTVQPMEKAVFDVSVGCRAPKQSCKRMIGWLLDGSASSWNSLNLIERAVQAEKSEWSATPSEVLSSTVWRGNLAPPSAQLHKSTSAALTPKVCPASITWALSAIWEATMEMEKTCLCPQITLAFRSAAKVAFYLSVWLTSCLYNESLILIWLWTDGNEEHMLIHGDNVKFSIERWCGCFQSSVKINIIMTDWTFAAFPLLRIGSTRLALERLHRAKTGTFLSTSSVEVPSESRRYQQLTCKLALWK